MFSLHFGHASAAPVWDSHDHFLRYDYDAVKEVGSTRVHVGLASYAEAISGAMRCVSAFAAECGPGGVVMVTVSDWDAFSFQCRTWETPALALVALGELYIDVACAAGASGVRCAV